FIAHLAIRFLAQWLPCFQSSAHMPVPPASRGCDRVLTPSRKECRKLGGFSLPMDGGEAHVAAIPDQMDKLGLGPKGVESRDVAHVLRSLIPHESFALTFSIKIEKSGHELCIIDVLCRYEQPFHFRPPDLHSIEPVVLE